MKAREKRERVLVGLYSASKASSFDRFLTLESIASDNAIPLDRGEARLIARDLEGRGFLIGLTITNGGAHARISTSGIEEAEDLIDLHPEYAAQNAGADYVPTSSISFDDDKNLETLAGLVRGSNSGTDTERTAALAEIAVFEASILQPVIATDLIDRFVNWVLKWITDKFTDAAIATVATAIIVKLAPFLAT